MPSDCEWKALLLEAACVCAACTDQRAAPQQIPQCGSYPLWNQVAGKDGAIDGIATSAPKSRMTAAVMPTAFDVFQRLLITNFNFLLCFWHISLSSFGIVVWCCVSGYRTDCQRNRAAGWNYSAVLFR